MQEMVERYLAAWNEKDAERRRELVDALWTEDGSYTDPLADAWGRAEIDRLIGAVQQQFPGGMMGTLREQLKQVDMADRLPAVLEEAIRVREEMGWPIMAGNSPRSTTRAIVPHSATLLRTQSAVA